MIKLQRIYFIEDVNMIQRLRGLAEIDQIADDWQMYGAYDDKNLVATCSFFKYHRLPHTDYPNGTVVEIGGAYTLPKYRGQGIMSYLIKFMLDDGKVYLSKCDAIVADSTDGAYNIYKKLGFVDSDDHRVWLKLKND